MNIWKPGIAGSLGLLLTGLLQAAPVPLEVFGRLPSLEDVALSPDGTEVAYVKTRGENRVLSVASLAERKGLVGLGVGQSKLRMVQWADNHRLWLLQTTTAEPSGILGP